MTHASQSILKRFSHLLSAHWIREALQAVFLILLARYSSDTYGQFMLAITIGQLMLFATEVGLNQHLATMLARKVIYPTHVLAQITLIKSVFMAAGWLVMLGFISWQDYTPELRLIIVIIATAIALEGIGNSFFVACQVLGRQDMEGKTRSLAALIGYGYGITALLAGIPSALVALFKGLETLTALTVVLRIFLGRARKSMRLYDIREVWLAWREGLVFTAMAVCAIFYNKINIFFLQSYSGMKGVAQYSATWQIVDGVSVLVSGILLGKVLFPLFAKLWDSAPDRFIRLARHSAAWLIAIAIPVSYILFVEADQLIPLIYGDNFGPAILMQKQLVGCILLAFVHNLASYLMISMRRQRILLVMYIAGLAFNLAACILLIPNNPLSGTAYAILLTKGFMALMTVSFCQMAIGLFTLRNLLELGLAVAAAAGIHFGLRPFLPRLPVEMLTLTPLLIHAFRLFRQQQTNSLTPPLAPRRH